MRYKFCLFPDHPKKRFCLFPSFSFCTFRKLILLWLVRGSGSSEQWLLRKLSLTGRSWQNNNIVLEAQIDLHTSPLLP